MRNARFPHWQTPPPGCRPPPPGHVTCDACWEANTHSLVDRMTEDYENITLPQTSFAGGKNVTSCTEAFL